MTVPHHYILKNHLDTVNHFGKIKSGHHPHPNHSCFNPPILPKWSYVLYRIISHGHAEMRMQKDNNNAQYNRQD